MPLDPASVDVCRSTNPIGYLMLKIEESLTRAARIMEERCGADMVDRKTQVLAGNCLAHNLVVRNAQH